MIGDRSVERLTTYRGKTRIHIASRPILILCCLMINLSCSVSPTPAISAEDSISEALALSNSIVFSWEGESLDVASPPSERLTLIDAVRAAVEHDPRLQAALARVQSALAESQQARLLQNPLLNILFRFRDGGGPVDIEAAVSQPIIALLRRPKKSAVADDRLRASVAESVSIALDSIREIKEIYTRIQSIELLLPVLWQRRTIIDRLERLASDRLAAGEGARVDVTTLMSQRESIEIDIADVNNDARNLRLSLARRIGTPSALASWILDARGHTTPLTRTENEWIEAALRTRPEIQQTVWELLALGGERDLSGLAVWSDLGIGLKFQEEDYASAGPELNIPLPVFNDGTVAKRAAEARIVESKHKLVDLGRGVIEDVRRAFSTFEASRQNLERMQGTLLPLQSQRRTQLEEIYNAGQSDITALLLAEHELLSSELKRIELDEKTTLSLIHLERAVGGAGTFVKVSRGEAIPHTVPSPFPTPIRNK